MSTLAHVKRRRAVLQRDIGTGREKARATAARTGLQWRAATLGASVGRLLAGRSRWRALAGVSAGIAVALAARRFTR